MISRIVLTGVLNLVWWPLLLVPGLLLGVLASELVVEIPNFRKRFWKFSKFLKNKQTFWGKKFQSSISLRMLKFLVSNFLWMITVLSCSCGVPLITDLVVRTQFLEL